MRIVLRMKMFPLMNEILNRNKKKVKLCVIGHRGQIRRLHFGIEERDQVKTGFAASPFNGKGYNNDLV